MFFRKNLGNQSLAASFLFIAFATIVAATFAAAFYVSPLREKIEDKLSDVRTRLAPSFASTNGVAVVVIDAEAIQFDAGTQKQPGNATPSQANSPPAELSIKALANLLRATLVSDPQRVIALLPPQVFSYADPAMIEIADLARNNPRLTLATFGIRADLELLPQSFLSLPRRQLVAAEVPRTFRRAVVRSVPATTEISSEDTPTLQPLLNPSVFSDGSASPASAPEKWQNVATSSGIRLNWSSKDSFMTIRGTDLMRFGRDARLAGNTVVLGYIEYRPLTLVHREATFVNSPWQADGDDLKDGVSLVILYANAIANLMHGTHLQLAPVWITVVQTVIITAATVAIWHFSGGVASLLFIIGWIVIFAIHALLFSFTVYIPLADTAVFSALATIVGGLWRLRVEGRLRASHEAEEAAQRQVAQMQERFLDRFAKELGTVNTRIRDLLVRNTQLGTGSGTIQKVYAKALASCDELTDYLRGIQQFAGARHASRQSVSIRDVDVGDVVTKVLKQFESRYTEAGLSIVWTPPNDSGQGIARGDATLVEQILFNLVSNAIKYSTTGKSVRIHIENKGAGRDAPGPEVHVVVADEGPGIAPEFHERIFEKFYRVKDDNVYRVKGHGLGLYLSRFFAKQIGGRIDVRSTQGAGATFVLRLPSADTTSRNAVPSKAPTLERDDS